MNGQRRQRRAEHACRDPKEVAATFDEVVRKMRRDAKATARPKVSRLAQAQRELKIP